ncbi:MAG: hypothetical protein GZ091_14785 [Paludibacter sp.]|nr:hypothetical protein [Paludibacter sp.]
MSNNILKITVLACMVATGTTSCNNTPKQKAIEVEAAKENLIEAQENVIKATGDMEQARIDSTNEYANYKRESDILLKRNELKIAQLKAKVISDRKELRLEYENKLNILEQKNTQLKVDMLDYKGVNKTEWEKFKLKFNQDMDALKLSISKMAEKNTD